MYDALSGAAVTGSQEAVYQAGYAYNHAVQITGMTSATHLLESVVPLRQGIIH